jgi:Holliday junction resolvasome RuvABC DNA-binding subunit
MNSLKRFKEQYRLFKKLPGIGPKAAAQIILDLKGKLVESDERATLPNTTKSAKP